jgi:hypothetical protein
MNGDSLPRLSTLHKFAIPAEELRLGDMQQIGRDFISRVRSIGPYWTGETPMHVDHRYVVVNNIVPPLAIDDVVEVWRES